jgi:hypothetical protein
MVQIVRMASLVHIATEREVTLQVVKYETHARLRVHEQGPQDAIDEEIPECEIVAGEHEIRRAIKSGKPEVALCFHDAPIRRTEAEDAVKVQKYREEISCLELVKKARTSSPIRSATTLRST